VCFGGCGRQCLDEAMGVGDWRSALSALYAAEQQNVPLTHVHYRKAMKVGDW
jgi:hypothetical protein